MHHENCQPTCQVSTLTFTHSRERLRLQGGILWPEISAEGLIWCEGTALRERVQSRIFQNHLTRMRVYLGQKHWGLGL